MVSQGPRLSDFGAPLVQDGSQVFGNEASLVHDRVREESLLNRTVLFRNKPELLDLLVLVVGEAALEQFIALVIQIDVSPPLVAAGVVLSDCLDCDFHGDDQSMKMKLLRTAHAPISVSNMSSGCSLCKDLHAGGPSGRPPSGSRAMRTQDRSGPNGLQGRKPAETIMHPCMLHTCFTRQIRLRFRDQAPAGCLASVLAVRAIAERRGAGYGAAIAGRG